MLKEPIPHLLVMVDFLRVCVHQLMNAFATESLIHVHLRFALLMRMYRFLVSWWNSLKKLLTCWYFFFISGWWYYQYWCYGLSKCKQCIDYIMQQASYLNLLFADKIKIMPALHPIHNYLSNNFTQFFWSCTTFFHIKFLLSILWLIELSWHLNI